MASNRRRFLVFLAAVVALLLLLPDSSATDVEYCSSGRDYPVKVSGVEIVPDPVVSGQPATFKISASTESHDLCEETSCPATGEFVLAHQQTLPSITPPGSYTITMKLLGDTNKELTCITIGFSIGFISPLAVI